jgi:hypothetical protein
MPIMTKETLSECHSAYYLNRWGREDYKSGSRDNLDGEELALTIRLLKSFSLKLVFASTQWSLAGPVPRSSMVDTIIANAVNRLLRTHRMEGGRLTLAALQFFIPAGTARR